MSESPESNAVLRAVYEEEILFQKYPWKDDEKIGMIASITELNNEIVREKLNYLYKVGLIESTDSRNRGGPYGLTDNGFEVLHDWEMRRRELEHEEKLRVQQQEHLEILREQQRQHEEDVAKRQMRVTKRTGVYTLFLVIAVSLQVVGASINIPGWEGALLGVTAFIVVIMVVWELFTGVGKSDY